ncbi:Tetratricopeptide repeat-like superfamily protein [Prunus dulcis]|uniref:Tetratricopeptide repeat-like superfamily protein n=1 Tax=Prunus dulcis TaxID=3755 RepID=A0A4Y1RRD1_PRUDU|nr:Tetratricopeptide repeat-like superfamily protein [Prunus dulcis]
MPGDVSGSVAEFDKAIELDPRQQALLAMVVIRSLAKGLSLYYLDRIQMIQRSPFGAFYVKLNYMGLVKQGNDFLRQVSDTRDTVISYRKVGQDPRPVMRDAYNMFKEGGDPEKARIVALAPRVSTDITFSKSRESDYFYASLYAGLYYESQKKTDAAELHIVTAYQSPYGQRSDDYMASLAKVHCLCRKWSLN